MIRIKGPANQHLSGSRVTAPEPLPGLSAAHQVCAIVTIFQPDGLLATRLQRVARQVGRVVVVDDSGRGISSSVELTSVWQDSRITLCCHDANYGQAAALNTGIRVAAGAGFEYVVLLDEDSLPDDDMIERLIKAWRRVQCELGRPVGVARLAHRDSQDPCQKRRLREGAGYREKRGVITAGTLLPMSVYTHVGPFREEFVIDSVDYDFCLRCRRLGYAVVQIEDLGLTHSVGRTSLGRLGPFEIRTSNHQPVRRYYQYRNSTALAIEYLRYDPCYSLAVGWFQLKTLLKITLLEDQKRAKLVHACHGFANGWSHHLGKFRVNGK